jgi:hypothetical protein
MSLYSTVPTPAPQGAQGAKGLEKLKAATSRTSVGPDGRTSYDTTYGADPEAEYALKEKYNTLAQNRLLGAMGTVGGGQGAPGVSRTSGDIAAKEQAGREAAFARAKEQTGQIAQSSLQSMRNNLARRGITGGGYAEQRGAEALAPATGRLQDFTREQLIQDLGNLQHAGDVEYQGGIQQRGQTLANQQSLLGLLKAGGIY